MKKLTLVVQDKYQTEALTKLREIGVVHIEEKTVSSDGLSRAFERKNRADNALSLIQPYKTPKKKKTPQRQEGDRRDRRQLAPGQRRGRRASDLMGVEEDEPYSLDAVNAPERPDLIDLMGNMGRDRKALQDRLVFLERERARVAAWGDFNPVGLKELAASGHPFFLYELIPEAFAALPKDIRYIKIGADKNAVRLVVLDKEAPGLTVFPMPEKSFSEMGREYEELKTKLDALEEKIKSFADRRPILQRDMAEIQKRIEFEAARAALEKVDDVPSELSFSYLTGFIPEEDEGRLKKAAMENGWAVMTDEPEPDEEVPTKLKNNKLVQLLYPLTDFLEVVPGYHEVDISPWFLLFFCVFFGMIFGDAAYGLILMIISLTGITLTLKKGVPGVFKMLFLLSIFNTVWGVLTCTWFGVETSLVPQFLRDISLSYISPAKTDQATVNRNLQLFCFSLALLQLTIAHFMSVVRTIKERTLRVFAEIGSLAMLWGMYFVVLYLVVGLKNLPMRYALYTLAGGFVLTFVFAAYEDSIGRSILSSVKNIISVVLGITNVFSDIMSYIRLWAVGLAGASIAETVNTMAGPMLGNFLVFVAVILLVFGHGMNLVLNVLSVLVHGVRLNTLEFSSHLGLTWSGTAYRPFAER